MRSSPSTAGVGTERFGDGGDAAGQKQRRRRRVERTSMLGSPRALWMVSSRSPWSSSSPEPGIAFAGRRLRGSWRAGRDLWKREAVEWSGVEWKGE
jgi:hypothetical protein